MQVEPASRGLFITLEGPDGSGKSRQAERLGRRFRAGGLDVVVTREPGGTPLGEQIRNIVLHAHPAPVPTADALLFSAARAQLVTDVIEPALQAGTIVIGDRHADSTLAYQGYGYGQSIDQLRRLGQYATGGLLPDITVVLDLPVEDGIRRKVEGADLTRFETDEGLAFHRRVREGFLALASDEPERFVVVDARGSESEVEEAILTALGPRLPEELRRVINFTKSSEPFTPQSRMNP